MVKTFTREQCTNPGAPISPAFLALAPHMQKGARQAVEILTELSGGTLPDLTPKEKTQEEDTDTLSSSSSSDDDEPLLSPRSQKILDEVSAEFFEEDDFKEASSSSSSAASSSSFEEVRQSLTPDRKKRTEVKYILVVSRDLKK